MRFSSASVGFRSTPYEFTSESSAHASDPGGFTFASGVFAFSVCVVYLFLKLISY